MSAAAQQHDAIIIGGGFYGAAIAVYLAKRRGLKRLVLLEREPALLMRASYNNQARVHNGYHYPRSFTTAYRSRVNFPEFVRNWPDAIKQDFTKLYAVAGRNSKVTSKQFERFCRDIGAKVQPANSALRGLFDPHLVEDVFVVEEYAFDAVKLASWAQRELAECGVNIRYNTHATHILKGTNDTLSVGIQDSAGVHELVSSTRVFNCTYSGLNQFKGDFTGTTAALKHELTEMALLQVPSSLEGLGITVMDGPFFSMMPFPALGLHTLSHVRYTPHIQWDDQQGVNPYQTLKQYGRATRADRMVRDVARYMPAMLNAKYIDSLFEIKTVLTKNELDDGRPILFEQHQALPGCYSVLGGKIDNIFDVLEKLDESLH